MGFVIAVVALILDIVFAFLFSSLAEQKGHYGKGPFWMCLLLGAIGYLYVAALPDLVLAGKMQILLGKMENMQTSKIGMTKAPSYTTPPAPLNAPKSTKSVSSTSSSKKTFDPDSYPAGPVG